MPWTPIISTAIAGQNTISSYLQGRKNRNMMDNQQLFQERMARNAHQYEVQDLKKAGLNPILSAGGSGAATPSGSSAPLPAPQIDLPGILQAQSIAQEQERINIEKANSAAGIAKALSETELNKADKLIKEGGVMSKYLGTTGGQIMNKVKKTISPLFNQQPLQMNSPSSGGELP